MKLAAVYKLKHRGKLRSAYATVDPDSNGVFYDWGPDEDISLTLVAPSEGRIIAYTSRELKPYDRLVDVRDRTGKLLIASNLLGFEVLSTRPTLDAMGTVYGYASVVFKLGEVNSVNSEVLGF